MAAAAAAMRTGGAGGDGAGVAEAEALMKTLMARGEEDEAGTDGWPEEIFVGPVPDRLLCPICQQVLRDAAMGPCQHACCDVCFRTWLRQDATCPVDREPVSLSTLRPARLHRDFVLELETKCAFAELGCTEVIKLEHRSKHIAQCEWRPRPCPNAVHGCTALVNKGSETRHIEAECAFTPCRCVNDGCPETPLRHALSAHLDVCEHAVVPCPNQAAGCGVSLKRKDVAAHVAQECRRQLVACGNEPCHVQLVREEMELHLAECPCRRVECVHGCGRLLLERDQAEHNCVRALANETRAAFVAFQQQVSGELQQINARLAQMQQVQQWLVNTVQARAVQEAYLPATTAIPGLTNPLPVFGANSNSSQGGGGGGGGGGSGLAAAAFMAPGGSPPAPAARHGTPSSPTRRKTPLRPRRRLARGSDGSPASSGPGAAATEFLPAAPSGAMPLFSANSNFGGSTVFSANSSQGSGAVFSANSGGPGAFSANTEAAVQCRNCLKFYRPTENWAHACTRHTGTFVFGTGWTCCTRENTCPRTPHEAHPA